MSDDNLPAVTEQPSAEFLAELLEADRSEAPSAIDTGERFLIKRGKYKGIELPLSIAEKPDQQEKIEKLKSEITADAKYTGKPAQLAEAYEDLRLEKEALEQLLSDVNLRISATEQLIEKRWAEEDMIDFHMASTGSKITSQPDVHVKIEDHDRFETWAKEHGYEKLFRLPWQTAAKIVKELILDAKPEPPGAKATVRKKIVYTPEKDK
jgi:hypothetical protein